MKLKKEILNCKFKEQYNFLYKTLYKKFFILHV
uniref:Uncharacterized protein n=1 Tax=viral metagenome TaxID=1070528 RepID=A0A6C0E4T9_9ZZZZ